MIENFSSLKSFTEKMAAQGAAIATEVIKVKRIGASERIAHHLAIEPESEIVYIKRLHFVDEEPIALFISHIRGDIGISEDDDFKRSIFELLENKCGIKISGGQKVIEATSANKEEAELLKIDVDEPVLLIRNTTFDTDNNPIEYAEGVYRSDRYKYVLKLKR